MKKAERTKQRILDSAREEFLEKGYKNASLRNIATRAEVTTGAIYGYYANKDEMFSLLLDPIMPYLFKERKDQNELFFLENKKIPTAEFSEKYLESFVQFMYQNFASFKLLLCCAGGSQSEDIKEHFIEFQCSQIEKLFNPEKVMILKETIHSLVTAFYDSVFEFVIHDVSQKTALEESQVIGSFFAAGWQKLTETLLVKVG